MSTADLLPRLQALLARWDDQAAVAARKLEHSKNPIAGGFYSGTMYGYEDCADDLAMLLKVVMAAQVER